MVQEEPNEGGGMRQLRIACCGMVVSTRPVFEPLNETQMSELADDLTETARILRPYGKVDVWVNEGNVSHLIRSWE
jgi:hypothetical protein